MERIELDQHVVGHEAIDVEDVRARGELHLRPKLHGVRGHGEIRFRVDARLGGRDVDRQTAKLRQSHRRRNVRGMEAAHRQQEVGVFAPVHAHRHVTRERERQDMRIEQRRVERDLPLAEIDDAEEIDLQVENGDVVRRQRHAQHAKDRECGSRNLQQQAEFEADQGGRAPAELRHRSDQETLVQRREDAPQVVDDARRVGDDVVREKHALERAVLHAGAQHIVDDGAIEAEQPAHAEEREAKAQLNRRKLCGDDDEKRETFAAVGHLRVQNPERLDRDGALELELQPACVFALVRIEDEKAAAGEASGVDGKADAVRRLESESEVERSHIARVERRIDLEPDALHEELERT